MLPVERTLDPPRYPGLSRLTRLFLPLPPMKALIPAAGYGTRFLPASKAVPKEMLPVLDKPAIQWIVEEALEAGAEEVIIVTSPDKPAIRAHFTPDPVWRVRLARKPEIAAKLEQLDAICSKVRFVEQTEQNGLGHAVLQAAPLLRNETEPLLILLGDALVSGSQACSREMVAFSRAYGQTSIIGLERVPPEKVSRYGIVAGMAEVSNDRLYRLTGLVEKPKPEDAPSDLAIAGRYLLDLRVFDLLADQRAGSGGEIQLTDAIQRLLALAPVYGYRYPGKRHDIGNPEGYLEALLGFLADRGE